jgi:hypothetical protein
METHALRRRVRYLLWFFVAALAISGLTALPLQWELNIYPFIAYGTDWLAFGHIAIAVAFLGPLRDPVKNLWVVEFAMIACILVIPWALIFGPLRGIPFLWRLLDCSFGVFGIIPLWLARNDIRRLAVLENETA